MNSVSLNYGELLIMELTDFQKQVFERITVKREFFFREKKYEEIFEILKLYVEKRENVHIQEAILYMVKHDLCKMVATMLEHDPSLMNKLFDPENIEKQESDEITKTAFETVHNLMNSGDSPGYAGDVFSLCVMFHMTSDDFEYLVEKYFEPKEESKKRFKSEISVFDKFLLPCEITDLLYLLEKRFDSDYFNQVWKKVDKTGVIEVADFIWDHLYDTRRITRCHPLNIWNETQLEIALNVAERCKLSLEKSKNMKRKKFMSFVNV
jgi:hypothetical protein